MADVLANTPDHLRTFFRKLTGPERLALQGFPPSAARDLPYDLICHAAGNAYPPPLILAVLGPMLLALSRSSCWKAWPNTRVISFNEPPEVADMLKACKRKPLVVDRAKAEKARARAKAKSRASQKKRRGRSSSS